MNYECSIYDEGSGQQVVWVSSLYVISRTGPFTEFTVSGRGSHMHGVVGPQANGSFLCLPEWQIGSGIAPLDDVFWNLERLSPLLGQIDAVTLANGLKQLKRLEDRRTRK